MIHRPANLALTLAFLSSAVVGCSDSGATAPDHAFRTMSTSMKEGRPDLVLEAFPPSYTADINGLVHTFGEKMDPEVWDRGFALVGKVVRVLDEKRDFLLKHPMVAMMTAGADTEEIQVQLDGAVKAYGDLAKSSIATVDGLKTMDINEFTKNLFDGSSASEINKSASSLAGQFDAEWLLGEYETEIVSEGDGVATIKLIPAEGEPTQVDMKQVDGHWVTKEIADGWDAQMAEARAELAKFTIEPDMKMQIVMGMGAVDAILDQLLAAKTEAEFGQALAMAMSLPDQLGLEMGE